MSTDQKITINVNLGGRTFPLKAHPDEVQDIETEVDELNKTIKDFQINYGRDMQDCLSMTLLKLALERSQKDPKASKDFSSQINALHTALDRILAEK